MEIMVYSLLWVMQDVYHQPYESYPIRNPRKPDVRNPSKAAASHHPVFEDHPNHLEYRTTTTLTSLKSNPIWLGILLGTQA